MSISGSGSGFWSRINCFGSSNRRSRGSDDADNTETRTREAAERALGKKWQGIQLAEALTRYGVDPETGKRINPYSKK